MDLVFRELSLSQAIPTGVGSAPTNCSLRLSRAYLRVICRIGNEGIAMPANRALARAKPNRCHRRPIVAVTIMLIPPDHRGESILCACSPRYDPVVRNAS